MKVYKSKEELQKEIEILQKKLDASEFFEKEMRTEIQFCKQKWIGFKKPKYIGIDFDCKGNPLIDWQETLKLKMDRDTVGYDFKVVAYKKVQSCMED